MIIYDSDIKGDCIIRLDTQNKEGLVYILPSLSLRKKNNRQKTRNTKVKSLLFFIFVLL